MSRLASRIEEIVNTYCNKKIKLTVAFNSKSHQNHFSKKEIEYYPIHSDEIVGDIIEKQEDTKEELKKVIANYKPDRLY